MATFETTAEIQAPAARVWAALSAVDAWPQWMPTVSGVVPLDGSTLSVGNRYRVIQPKLRPVIWTVSVIEAGHRFEWQSKATGMKLLADHVVESIGPSSARVILRFEFNGLVGALLGVLFGNLTRDYLRREAQALRVRAEQGK